MNRNYYIKQIRDLSKNYDRDAQSKILDELTDKFFDVDGIKELYDILMEEVYGVEESKVTKMKQDNFKKFNEWLDTCPFGDYITNKLDYDPKTNLGVESIKVPNISKALRDSLTQIPQHNFIQNDIINDSYRFGENHQ